MNNIIPFQFKSLSVRTFNYKGAAYFIAKDVAECLGYERPSDAVAQHCKRRKSLKSLGYGGMEVSDLIAMFGTTSILVIPESDVYRLIMRSNLESAEEFQDWVAEEVLPTIRKTGSYSFPPRVTETYPLPVIEIQIAEATARMLQMSETSRIRMMTTICHNHGTPSNFLPVYTDEPLTSALGDLLKKHDAPWSAVKLNPILEKMGLLKSLERTTMQKTPANEDVRKKDSKKFWSITEEGLVYGKNETSVQCPNETQPRWFVSTFPDLIDKVQDWLQTA